MTTVRRPSGMRTSTFRRLCSRAPAISMASAAVTGGMREPRSIAEAAACGRAGRCSARVAYAERCAAGSGRTSVSPEASRRVVVTPAASSYPISSPSADHRTGADQGAAHAGAAADAATVEQQRVLDLRADVHQRAAAHHAPDHRPAADDGALAEQRVERLAGMGGRTVDDLRGRQAVAHADQRPARIVEVQTGRVGAQLHVGAVVCLHAGRLVPVGPPRGGRHRDEVARHDVVAAHERRQERRVVIRAHLGGGRQQGGEAPGAHDQVAGPAERRGSVRRFDATHGTVRVEGELAAGRRGIGREAEQGEIGVARGRSHQHRSQVGVEDVVRDQDDDRCRGVERCRACAGAQRRQQARARTRRRSSAAAVEHA